MQADKMTAWLQIVGNGGILIGLVLVIVQINQSSELARLQLETSVGSDWMGRQEAMMGEAPAAALARAIDDPQTMDTEALFVVEHTLAHYLEYWLRLKRLSDEGITSPDRWREDFDNPGGAFAYYFGNPVSQAWWSSLPAFGDSEFDAAVNAALAEVSPDASADRIADFVEAIRSTTQR